jgi:hypothetical protein
MVGDIAPVAAEVRSMLARRPSITQLVRADGLTPRVRDLTTVNYWRGSE